MKATSKKILSLALAAAMTLPLGMASSFAAEGDSTAGMNVSYYKMAENYGGILGGGGFTQDYSVATTKQFDASIDTLMLRSYAWGAEEQVSAIDTAPGGDDYLVHWTGTLTAKAAGTYQICGHRIDNGFVMKVNGNKVYEYWGDHWGDNGACMTDGTTFTLAEGEKADVEMWFLELGGGEALDVFAKNTEGVETNVNEAFNLELTKQVYFHRDGNNYLNDYIGNGNGAWGDGSGGNGGQCVPANQKFDEALLAEDWMEPWTDGMATTADTFASAVVDANSYVIKYTGSMTPKESGIYFFGANVIDNGFYLEIGDGNTVAYEFWTGRTWNDDGSGNTHQSNLVLEAGKAYNFTAYFLETDGGQALDLVCSVNGGDRISVNDAFTFSTEAAEYDDSCLYELHTIDSVDEFVAFSEVANATGRSFMAKETIIVTTDLDMSGVDYTPVNNALFVLDFQGYTVSNLHRTVTANDHVYAGLIADYMYNDNFNSGVVNLKLKDSSITVTCTEEWNYPCVGAVIGFADRAYAENITLENVWINVDATSGAAGALIGHKQWDCAHPNVTASLKDVAINFPNAEGVGLLVGRRDGDASVVATDLSIENLVIDTNYVPHIRSYIGLSYDYWGEANSMSDVLNETVDVDGTLSIYNIDIVPGCGITGEHDESLITLVGAVEETCTEAGYTGDLVCSDCGTTIEYGSEIAATGHGEAVADESTAVNSSCTEDGKAADLFCPDCGELLEEGAVITAPGHAEGVADESTAVAPTCTEAGKEADLFCPDCGELLEEGAEVPATGHVETELKNAKDATATEDGYTGDKVCTECGETVEEGEVIPATGEDNTDDKEDDKPAKTGDATLVAVTLAVVALAGMAVVASKKRHTAE